jgi:hypothetical protein
VNFEQFAVVCLLALCSLLGEILEPFSLFRSQIGSGPASQLTADLAAPARHCIAKTSLRFPAIPYDSQPTRDSRITSVCLPKILVFEIVSTHKKQDKVNVSS